MPRLRRQYTPEAMVEDDSAAFGEPQDDSYNGSQPQGYDDYSNGNSNSLNRGNNNNNTNTNYNYNTSDEDWEDGDEDFSNDDDDDDVYDATVQQQQQQQQPQWPQSFDDSDDSDDFDEEGGEDYHQEQEERGLGEKRQSTRDIEDVMMHQQRQMNKSYSSGGYSSAHSGTMQYDADADDNYNDYDEEAANDSDEWEDGSSQDNAHQETLQQDEYDNNLNNYHRQQQQEQQRHVHYEERLQQQPGGDFTTIHENDHDDDQPGETSSSSKTDGEEQWGQEETSGWEESLRMNEGQQEQQPLTSTDPEQGGAMVTHRGDPSADKAAVNKSSNYNPTIFLISGIACLSISFLCSILAIAFRNKKA